MDIEYFRKPNQTFSYSELSSSANPPKSSGIYAWYFWNIPPLIPTDGLVHIRSGWLASFAGSYSLLYIGKAKDLSSRLMKYHFDGSQYPDHTMSSLRLSLGCLLHKELNSCLYFWKNSRGITEYHFSQTVNVRLTKWIKDNARIALLETTEYDQLEKSAIKAFTPPLNTIDNTDHPFCSTLKGIIHCFKTYALPLDSDLYEGCIVYPPKLAFEAGLAAIKDGEV